MNKKTKFIFTMLIVMVFLFPLFFNKGLQEIFFHKDKFNTSYFLVIVTVLSSLATLIILKWQTTMSKWDERGSGSNQKSDLPNKIKFVALAIASISSLLILSKEYWVGLFNNQDIYLNILFYIFAISLAIGGIIWHLEKNKKIVIFEKIPLFSLKGLFALLFFLGFSLIIIFVSIVLILYFQ